MRNGLEIWYNLINLCFLQIDYLINVIFYWILMNDEIMIMDDENLLSCALSVDPEPDGVDGDADHGGARHDVAESVRPPDNYHYHHPNYQYHHQWHHHQYRNKTSSQKLGRHALHRVRSV